MNERVALYDLEYLNRQIDEALKRQHNRANAAKLIKRYSGESDYEGFSTSWVEDRIDDMLSVL